MRVEASSTGTREIGFSRPDEGWHLFKFEEGAGVFAKKEGEELKPFLTKNGDKQYKFPLTIADENDTQDGLRHDIIVAEDIKGEKALADYIVAASPAFWKKLAEKFPGDVSLFSAKILEILIPKIQGAMFWAKIKHSPNKKDADNPYANIIGWGPATKTAEQLEAELFPKKAGKEEKGKAESKPAATVDDFDM